MILEQIKKQISLISSQKPDGFTYNPYAKRFQSKGYVVASSQTQDCFGKSGLFRVIKFCLRHPDYCIGGWRNEDGIMQYDASRVFLNMEEAVRSAIDNEQRAIFNLYTGKVIMACDYSVVA